MVCALHQNIQGNNTNNINSTHEATLKDPYANQKLLLITYV